MRQSYWEGRIWYWMKLRRVSRSASLYLPWYGRDCVWVWSLLLPGRDEGRMLEEMGIHLCKQGRRRAENERSEKELTLTSLQEPRNHIDDEYAKVGTYDPKVVITTSRSPSSRLLQFSKVCLVLLPPIAIHKRVTPLLLTSFPFNHPMPPPSSLPS